MSFEIFYSPEAIDHLLALSRFEQALVVDQVEQQLRSQPALPTRRRKVLRPNPIAAWELRLGDIRVFYEVQETPDAAVYVKVVGKKIHNLLWIGGESVEL
jgi:mRNA-degrading endonuclease RelE of RelBE toxin-antitoxin system